MDLQTIEIDRKFNVQVSSARLLDIVIPTRNRCNKLKQLLAVLQLGFENKKIKEDVHVIVAINDLESNYIDAINQFSGQPWITFKVNKEIKPTAEESAITATAYSSATYVWFMGDDDEPIIDNIPMLIAALRHHEPSYVLLNIMLNFKGVVSKYYSISKSVVKYNSSLDLYKRMGFASATTTLSAICIKRECIDLDDYMAFNKISAIYSHSVYFMYCFYKKKCLLLNTPFIIRNENSPEDEYNSIQRYLETQGESFYYAFTIGIILLLTHLSTRLNLRLRTLLTCHEVEFSKGTGSLVCSRTIDVIYAHLSNIDLNDAKSKEYHDKTLKILSCMPRSFKYSAVRVLPNNWLKRAFFSGLTDTYLILKNLCRKNLKKMIIKLGVAN